MSDGFFLAGGQFTFGDGICLVIAIVFVMFALWAQTLGSDT